MILELRGVGADIYGRVSLPPPDASLTSAVGSIERFEPLESDTLESEKYRYFVTGILVPSHTKSEIEELNP